jgi:molecular chaperone DnaK (HSP70)
MSEKYHKVIGIDLGTTYSAVAAYNKFKEQAEIIKNSAEGDTPTTPSVVSLDPSSNKAIAGYAAKRNLASQPENTIIEIKREMGEVFRPETLKKYGAEGKFTGTGPEPDPVKVHFNAPWLAAEEQWFTPQEISAIILMKMKEIAEVEMKVDEIRDAVVTVPAYFKEKQKKATEEAALLAGLYPRQLIPGSTAAAICYGVDKLETGKKVYLVYDLGGGTIDVSIIEVEKERIQVLATSGDSLLGGSDFDDVITRWAVEQLKDKYGKDVQNDLIALAYIKARAENAKILLNTCEKTSLDLTFADSQAILQLELTREKLIELIEPFLRKSLTEVDKAIIMAHEQMCIPREYIDALLLVGGSSKIPKVKEMLLDYFGKDESFVRSDINPDSVVARGAAIMACRFAPSSAPFDIKKRKESILLNEEGVEEIIDPGLITEHSLGIGIQENRVERIINKGTNLPVEIKKSGIVNPGPCEEIIVQLFQGEGRYTYENTLIGSLHLGPMEPKPRNFHKFELTFKLDKNGLLNIIVHHINEQKTYETNFVQKTGIGGEEKLIAKRKKLMKLYY